MKTPPEGERHRPALDETRLNAALPDSPRLWRGIRVVQQTGSTNADLLAQARSGAPQGLVLVAEEQTAGRGRLGRSWISPPRASLTFSVLLRPSGVPAGLLGWAPLLTGVAVASALQETAAVDARLKWPNDVLVGSGKVAGILAESWGDAIVVGAGLNVWQRADELPVPTATSVFLAAPEFPAAAESAGASQSPEAAYLPGRERLLVAVLGHLARWYRAWLDQDRPGDAEACGLRQEYQRSCSTVGKRVTVMLPGGRSVTGAAVDVDAAGRLEVRTGSGLVPVSAGDVEHLR
jgi:BirA family transcriptional regulator, biotin operon repressor / biotin---[acetyl-CoA-carboxylase] ligase